MRCGAAYNRRHRPLAACGFVLRRVPTSSHFVLTLLSAVAVLLQPAPNSAATASATSELAATVAALVAEFDAPQRSARDEAERKLTALGPAALEHLPELGPGASAERSIRLRRVRSALYQAQVAASLRGSQVEWPRSSAKPAAVLAAFERQSGNRLIDYRRQFGQQVDDLALTFETPPVSFWEGIDRLCAAAGVEPYYFAGEDGLALVARPEGASSAPWAGRPSNVDYRGAFRVEVERLSASRSPAAAAGELRIDLSAAWEPRLKPMFVTLAMRKLAATDDAGRPLEPLNADLVLEIPPPGKACRIETAATFQAPPRSAARLAHLRGSFDVLIPAALHTFRFAPLAAIGKRTEEAGAVSVTLEAPRLNGDVVEAVVRLRYAHPANALESHRAWFYKNPAYLEAADGTRTKPGTIELLRQAEDELMLNLLFPATDDWRTQALVYQTPADLVVVPAEFEFKDLPLP